MEKKNFFTRHHNPRIAPGFMENGGHMDMTEEELVQWFTDPDRFPVPLSKTTDIEIYEDPEGYMFFEGISAEYKKSNRMDLVLQIITPYTAKEKQIFVLESLKQVSNKKMNIPLISENKSFTYDEIVKEVSDLTETGKAFIDQWMETRKEFLEVVKKS